MADENIGTAIAAAIDPSDLPCARCHRLRGDHPWGKCATFCRCGSGAHPRRCPTHPERFEEHCKELDAESLERRVARIERILFRLRTFPWLDKNVRDVLCEIDVVFPGGKHRDG